MFLLLYSVADVVFVLLCRGGRRGRGRRMVNYRDLDAPEETY